MEYKLFNFKVDTESVTESGEFSGYASTFGNKDQGGDIVLPGAFDQWLSEWKTSGNPLPILWNHDSRDVRGAFKSITPDDTGLWVVGQLNQKTEGGRDAREYVLQPAVNGMSIGFDIYPGGIRFDAERDAYLLGNLELWEISIATFPMNRNARIETVKSALTRGGEPTLREIERALREQGFGKREAKVIATTAGGTLGLRDDTSRDGELSESLATEIKAALDRAIKGA